MGKNFRWAGGRMHTGLSLYYGFWEGNAKQFRIGYFE